MDYFLVDFCYRVPRELLASHAHITAAESLCAILSCLCYIISSHGPKVMYYCIYKHCRGHEHTAHKVLFSHPTLPTEHSTSGTPGQTGPLQPFLTGTWRCRLLIQTSGLWKAELLRNQSRKHMMSATPAQCSPSFYCVFWCHFSNSSGSFQTNRIHHARFCTFVWWRYSLFEWVCISKSIVLIKKCLQEHFCCFVAWYPAMGSSVFRHILQNSVSQINWTGAHAYKKCARENPLGYSKCKLDYL